jgi:mannosyl-3-phosphoglycerate phosphatase
MTLKKKYSKLQLPPHKTKIVFSDLDGTFLDSATYSYTQAQEGLNVLNNKHVPLIICTSKTRAEIEYWRKKIKNDYPFISENGGGIFIPKKFFNFTFPFDKQDKHYFIIQLGTDYRSLTQVIDFMQKKYSIKSFHSMTVQEVVHDAGLTIQQARLAKQREFDEPFRILDEAQQENVFEDIKKNNLKYTFGGRYNHILGNAVNILSRLFRKQLKEIITIGIGDSENDFKMLDVVNKPYLVMKRNKTYASRKYHRANGIGPEGWNSVILKEVNQ